jgi:zinc D-Ala-D-Ala carboxypeptidase
VVKKLSIALLLAGALTAASLGAWQYFRKSNTPSTPPQAITASDFNKKQHSLTDPASIWVVVNKTHPLPQDYTPAALVAPQVPLRLDAHEEQMQVSAVLVPAIEQLFAAAAKDGLSLKLSSAYRPYTLQQQFFDSYMAEGGESAETYSARAGASEHQTGLAVDIIPLDERCSLDICFADTPEGKWLAAHAHKYGFITRYPKGKQASTGYQYEPWHIRYVGTELATELHKNKLTLEEFFNYR